MAKNTLGIEIPAGSDPFDPAGDMVALADSLAGRIVIPVANTTERNALAAALSPSSAAPLVVRFPSGLVQSTTNGSDWRTEATPASTGTIATTANWSSSLQYAVSHGGTVTITGSPQRVGNASSSPATDATVVAAGGVPSELRPWSTIYGTAYASNARRYFTTITTAGLIQIRADSTSGDLSDGSFVRFSFPAYPVA